MHEVWRIILDKEFLHAYKHGIVIRCPDGIMRRIFPRIFTYSADYPEKYIYKSEFVACLLNASPGCFWLPFATLEQIPALVVLFLRSEFLWLELSMTTNGGCPRPEFQALVCGRRYSQLGMQSITSPTV